MWSRRPARRFGSALHNHEQWPGDGRGPTALCQQNGESRASLIVYLTNFDPKASFYFFCGALVGAGSSPLLPVAVPKKRKNSERGPMRKRVSLVFSAAS